MVFRKPFALNIHDADRAIETAVQCDRILAPFQNRRYDPIFLKIQEVIASGVLGRIVQIRITNHAFARRWDWQTLRELGGGSLNNNGSHDLDQALELFGEGDCDIFCHLDTALSCGDADDHAKVILRGKDKPLIEVEVSAACAYPQDQWLVMGTRGGLRARDYDLAWRWVDFEKVPPRTVETEPSPQRAYNHETLTWEHATWQTTQAACENIDHAFYADLHQTLCGHLPLVVSPQSVRRQIAVLEHCHNTAQSWALSPEPAC